MAPITGKDRSQLLLLPDAVDDYVGPDNPVRFMDALVDGLDLEAAGFQRARPTTRTIQVTILRSSRPMHQKHLPTDRPLRERGDDGPDGGTPRYCRTSGSRLGLLTRSAMVLGHWFSARDTRFPGSCRDGTLPAAPNLIARTCALRYRRNCRLEQTGFGS